MPKLWENLFYFACLRKLVLIYSISVALIADGCDGKALSKFGIGRCGVRAHFEDVGSADYFGIYNRTQRTADYRIDLSQSGPTAVLGVVYRLRR